MAQDPVLIIRIKSDFCCVFGHGLPECIFRVKESKWKRYGEFLKSRKGESLVKRDYSCYDHKCMITHDILRVYKEAEIIDGNACSTIQKFVTKIENKAYLNILEALSNGNKKEEEEKEPVQLHAINLGTDKYKCLLWRSKSLIAITNCKEIEYKGDGSLELIGFVCRYHNNVVSELTEEDLKLLRAEELPIAMKIKRDTFLREFRR